MAAALGLARPTSLPTMARPLDWVLAAVAAWTGTAGASSDATANPAAASVHLTSTPPHTMDGTRRRPAKAT